MRKIRIVPNDFVRVKRYGDRYKLVYFKLGLWHDAEGATRPERAAEGGSGEKLAQSLSRTRNAVFELAACNAWDWFATFTLDAVKRDRLDLAAFRKTFAQWLRNYNRLHGCTIQYLFVPEPHKDGAWHMHGLLRGVPDAAISDFVKGVHPQKLIDGGFKNWADYAKRFGFCSLGAVRDPNAVSGYLTKYISKSLAERREDLGGHLYYASQGLRRAEVVGEGVLGAGQAWLPDWENEYIGLKWYDSAEQLPRLI